MEGCYWQEVSEERYRFPATISQKSLWFIHRMNPHCAGYQLPMGVKFGKNLDVNALIDAINIVIQRHEALRTSFEEDSDGEIWQVIPERATLHVPVQKFPDAVAAEQAMRNYLKDIIPIEKGPLIQAALFISPDSCFFTLRFHHVIVDHISTEIVAKDISLAYAARRAHAEPQFQEQILDYGDFAAWQAETYEVLADEKKTAFWRNLIQETVGCINMPTDFPRPRNQTFRGDEFRQTLPKVLAASVRNFSRVQQQPLFITLLTAYSILMQRYTKQEQIIIGVPFGNRLAEGMDQVVGLIMNMLPIPCEIEGYETFLELCSEVKERLVSAQNLQDVPLPALVETLPVSRDPAYNPLFQLGFSVQPPPAVLSLDDVDSVDLQLHPFASVYDFQTWVLDEPDGGLSIQIWYDDSLYQADTVARMADHFAAIVRACVDNPRISVNKHQIITKPEVEQINAWNENDVPESEIANLAAWVVNSLSQATERACLVVAGEELTAQQLLDRSGSIAVYLHKAGVQKNDLVGVMMERTIDLLPTLLGIMRAGAGYVPMDPSYPEDLLRYIADDANLKWVCTQSSVADRLPVICQRRVFTMDMLEDEFAEKDEQPELPSANRDDTAYVIYTSGSTGKPKGVVIPHSAIMNLLAGMTLDEPGLNKGENFLAVTTLSFDISVLELFGPLVSGAKLIIASRVEAMDGKRLIDRLEQDNIQVMQATPTTWRLLIETGWCPPTGFRAWCGGEPLPYDLAREMIKKGVELWNLYGPTETTVWSTTAKIMEDHGVHIGRGIRNTKLYVLDESQQLMPIGIPGELYIGGAGLATGYLNRPEMTAERFIYHDYLNEKIYRTGDLVRMTASGNVEHLGRLDHQVKVRGYRVELGQIEAALLEHEQVTDCVVHAKEFSNHDQRLIAYVACDDPSQLRGTDLRAYARKLLPDYMIPQFFITMAALPRTPNGKIDRNSLPTPLANEDNANAEVPESAAEKTLAKIWCDAIGLTSVGRNDNFFAIGGHSLLAVKVLNKIEAQFNCSPSLHDLLSMSLREVAANLPQSNVTDLNDDPAKDKSDGGTESKGLLSKLFGRS